MVTPPANWVLQRVPVDDYFNDYVHGLTTMAHQQGAPPRGGPSGRACEEPRHRVERVLGGVLKGPKREKPGCTCTRLSSPPRPSPAPSAAAAHPCSDGPRPSDSCGPPSSTAVPLGSGLAPSSTAAPTPLLHPQQAAAWPMGLAPASGVPALQQLGHMAVVPMPLAAGVPVGLVAAGKQPAAAHCNGKAANGRSGASAQRQATNREAQKRYRCELPSWWLLTTRRLQYFVPQQDAGRPGGCAAPHPPRCQPPSCLFRAAAGSGRRRACWRCR